MLNDIENPINIKDNNNSINNKTDDVSDHNSDDSITVYEKENNICTKLLLIFIIIIFTFPLTFFDIYYGYDDNSCVNNSVKRININLKEYLVVRGIINVCFIFQLILFIIIYNKKIEPFIACQIIILSLIGIFYFCWDIIGGIIFWNYMDNSSCSNDVYNYIFASIIIKYILSFTGIVTNYSKNN